MFAFAVVHVRVHIDQDPNDHTLNSKAQFTTVHQLSKAVSLVQDNMDIFSENFNPNDILEVVNGPLFEKPLQVTSTCCRGGTLTCFWKRTSHPKLHTL